MDTLNRVVREFGLRFGHPPEVMVRSPGRVNLIGDHTDYNGGWVLPMTISSATFLVAGKSAEPSVNGWSLDQGMTSFRTDDLTASGGWEDYLKGVLRFGGFSVETGWNLVVGTDIPIGAGLSSSAALAMAWTRALVELTGRNWNPAQAALWGEQAENHVVGMPCGPMDHLAVGLGGPGSAVLIDCHYRDTRQVSLPAEGQVVILDTGTRRNLVGASYGDRRRECENIAAQLGVPTLRELPPDFDQGSIEEAGLDGVKALRLRHVLSESRRVLEVVQLLAEGETAAIGELLTESHRSLRDDFGVSGPALDQMVETALSAPGCWGARMTGGGFAGCAIAWVNRNQTEAFCEEVTGRYLELSGRTGSLYPTDAAEPVSLV